VGDAEDEGLVERRRRTFEGEPGDLVRVPTRERLERFTEPHLDAQVLGDGGAELISAVLGRHRAILPYVGSRGGGV
jgi:hypothetical protein